MTNRSAPSWNAILAVLALLTLISGVVFGVYTMVQDEDAVSVSTEGDKSPATIGDGNVVNVK